MSPREATDAIRLMLRLDDVDTDGVFSIVEQITDGPAEPAPVFLVYERDGTSMTGSPKLIGATTDERTANAAADAIHARNSWHSGYVKRVEPLPG